MVFQDWKDAAHAAGWDTHGDKTNPTRQEQLDIMLSVMADAYQPGKWTLDLGFGSGQVEKMIFDHIPEAKVVGVDSSREMMALAAKRLAPYAERYQAIEQDLAQTQALILPEHPYQFAISIQALHHLTPDEMQAAYHFIYRILEPDGLFLLLDRMRVEIPALWSAIQSVWARQDRVYGSTIKDHEGATFVEHEQIVRGHGDLPVGPEQHLSWMRDAGFEAAILHLHGNRALIAARKLR